MLASKLSRRRSEIGRTWQALDLEDARNKRLRFLKETEAELQSEAKKLQDSAAQAPLSFYASLLKRCGIARALGVGQSIHKHISRFHGPNPEASLGNPLIQMYGKCGSTDSAREVFNAVHHKTIYTWNLMLAAYTQNTQYGQTLQLFQSMEFYPDLTPNAITYSTVVSACTFLSDLDAGRKIHAQILARKVEIDAVLGTSLINMYGKCRSVNDARDLFDSIQSPCLVTWNTMLSIYVQNDRCPEALRLFQRMIEDPRAQPDAISYTNAIRACAEMKNLTEGRMIHHKFLSSETPWDVVLGNELMRMYGTCGSINEVKEVFDAMPSRNSVSWTSLATTYTHHGHLREAMELYWITNIEGVKPHRIIFPTFISACSTLREGQGIHECLESSGVSGDTAIANSLVTMYGRFGAAEEAKRVFDRIHQKTVISWTSLIAANAQNGDWFGALQLFNSMAVPPNEVTLLTILDACSSMGTLAQGRAIHAGIRGCELERDLRVRNAMINMYGRCGSSREAREIFDSMRERNLVSWTCLLAANAREGDGRRVLEVYGEMEQEGVELDSVVFVSVLTSLSHAGLVEDCRECFLGMAGRVEVEVEHYNCVVDLLGRVGWIADALDLLQNMPFEPPYEARVSLLGCCNTHEEWQLVH